MASRAAGQSFCICRVTFRRTRLLAVAMHNVAWGRTIGATLLRKLKPGDLIRWELNGNHLEWVGVSENEN